MNHIMYNILEGCFTKFLILSDDFKKDNNRTILLESLICVQLRAQKTIKLPSLTRKLAQRVAFPRVKIRPTVVMYSQTNI